MRFLARAGAVVWFEATVFQSFIMANFAGPKFLCADDGAVDAPPTQRPEQSFGMTDRLTDRLQAEVRAAIRGVYDLAVKAVHLRGEWWAEGGEGERKSTNRQRQTKQTKNNHISVLSLVLHANCI